MSKQVDTKTRRLAPVPVVTVFLHAAGKIALFKRSGMVGTYAGAWAGVSGYVDRLPLDQAFVEVHEEAGLSRDDVELRGIGVPVLVDDEALGRRWIVYPFLFDCCGSRKIRTDWESESIEWVVPEDLPSRPTVPGLDRALASVWPPFGDPPFWAGLAEVATDTTRSSTALALAGLECLESYLVRDVQAPRERAVKGFAACRSSMGVFPHLAVRYLTRRPRQGEIAKMVAQATRASAECAAKSLTNCPSLLTCSYSSAVREALVMLGKASADFEVFVTESRPAREGVDLARDLAREGIRVSVITDAQASLFVREVDAVLVGCDAISEFDEVQNKVGTSLLVMAAREVGVRCYAVTQTLKIVPPGFPCTIEEQEPDKVGRADGVRFRNLVFDTVPIGMFDAVFCETGPLTPEQTGAIRSQLGAVRLNV